MLSPVKMVDIELSKPLPTFEGLDGYIELKGLVRLHGVPIGYIQAPLTAGGCTDKTLSKLILGKHSKKIISQLLENGLAAPPHSDGLRLEDLFDVPPPQYQGTLPLVTVAVCTRDRPTDLDLCCEALNHLDYPHLDILIVDNAPSSDASERLVQEKYPHFRYVKEPRPGLDWARNRAIIEAKGEIIAYTDDDVVVDTGWVRALANLFAENPEVMAATGLVVPYELETEAQVLFEIYGGFGRGFESKWHRVEPGKSLTWGMLGTGDLGTGANMAYRRSLFDQIGYFDSALDVGTVTNGGGDLEMFFRVLKEGHTLVYEPKALIRHRHRRDYEKLRTQLTNNSLGLLSYCVRSIIAYPEEWRSFLRLILWWVWSWNLKRLWATFKNPTRFPRDLVWAEFSGCLPGLTRYQKARQTAAEIAESFRSSTPEIPEIKHKQPVLAKLEPKLWSPTAVKMLDLSQPLEALTDVAAYASVRIFVKGKESLLGSVDISNSYQPISKSRLIDIIVSNFGLAVFEPDRDVSEGTRWQEAMSVLTERLEPRTQETAVPAGLPATVSVSVVVATYDRPKDLHNCLRYLLAQESLRPIEIVVVDNNPASGLTAPVVAEFPAVVIVCENRKGLAYARNAGITASRGEILVFTDDDVTVPPDWLEKMVAPFVREDVASVTGNVLPLELENESQHLFEIYGGLGRGFNAFEANEDWFESYSRDAAPTWSLGASANAAFRASIFSKPEIGLMKEALGPGMPSGVGEDTYLFYKVIKARYSIVYEPAAYVWHKHRKDMEALRRQIYNYSKGHVAYNLTTWLDDGDWRGLWRVLFKLPKAHLYRIKERFMRRSDYSISLVLLEIAGNLAGPWSLWRSHQRVKREGHSAPYIPVSERSDVALKQVSATVNSQQLTVNS